MVPLHPERRVFYRGDNVLEHWVDHAQGFEIRSRSGVRFRARVDKVVVDPHRGRAKALIVRSARLHRRRLIPVEAVVAVDPFARRLEIERARPRLVARGSHAAVQLAAAVAALIGRLVAWSAPRMRRMLILAFAGARGIARRAAAAWAWLAPRMRTAGVAAGTLVLGLVLRVGGALATGARSLAAWSAPRLAAGASGARTHTAAAAAALGPRLSHLARAAARQTVAFGRLCVLGVRAAASWAAPRLRTSAEAVAWTVLTLGVAAAGALHLVGTRLSKHERYASAPRRD